MASLQEVITLVTPYLSMVSTNPKILVFGSIAILVALYLLKKVINMLPILPPFNTVIDLVLGLIIFVWLIITGIIAYAVYAGPK